MNSDGSNKDQISFFSSNSHFSEFSSDGSKILLVTDGEVYLSDLLGGDLVNLSNHLFSDSNPKFKPQF